MQFTCESCDTVFVEDVEPTLRRDANGEPARVYSKKCPKCGELAMNIERDPELFSHDQIRPWSVVMSSARADHKRFVEVHGASPFMAIALTHAKRLADRKVRR